MSFCFISTLVYRISITKTSMKYLLTRDDDGDLLAKYLFGIAKNVYTNPLNLHVYVLLTH